jgi:hypothetical protein
VQNLLTRLFCLAIAVQLMGGCTGLQPGGSVAHLASIQNQRAASAELALQELEDIDVLIKLDNVWLANQLETEIKTQADIFGQFDFRELKLTFGKQLVFLEAIVDISDQQDNVIAASVSGDILLDFSADRLEWLPRFSQLSISSRNFTYKHDSYTEPTPELSQQTLQDINSDIAQGLVEDNKNIIPLNAVPLAELEVGASLPGFSDSSAQHTQALRGVFTVTGSAMLIDSSMTTIALDMAFVPYLSVCPADVTVSRAEFVKKVRDREPVGIAQNLNNAANIRHFYSEISGARRNLTIIHYWFADGLPQAVEELTVGPSTRWRTWSDRGSAHADARRLKVLVVEKESGCILLSKSIRTLEPENAFTRVDQLQARRTFTALRDDFNNRTADFSIFEEQPGIALIEIRRPFLLNVLQTSLADLNIDTEFDSSSLSASQYSAIIQPFDTGDIICEHRNCPPATVCKTNLSHCKRLRDTRDCSSCLFRNPLNNRCVSETIDPLCEASRNRQNDKYEADRTACITNAETLRQECDQLNANAVRSCQIESGFEESACESVKSSIEALKQGGILAHVSAQTNTRGKLSVNFSNFRIEGDLSGLKLDMRLNTDLQLDGVLNFSPDNSTPPLADCIAAWSAPFKTRLATTPAVSDLLSDFEESSGTLTASWSSFGLTINTNPSPLDSIFVGNPQLLANCSIGLTMYKLEQAFTGDGAKFFLGQLDMEIQPLPTKIHLAPATIEFGDQVYSADANLSDLHLRYDIGE